MSFNSQELSIKNKIKELENKNNNLIQTRIKLKKKYDNKINHFNLLIKNIIIKENETNLILKTNILNIKNIQEKNNNEFKLKNEKLEKEQLIFNKEQQRIKDKQTILNTELSQKINSIKNINKILELNNIDLEKEIKHCKTNTEYMNKEKYITRLNMKSSMIDYKNNIKLKKKNKLIFKNKIKDIETKINILSLDYENIINKKKNANYTLYDIKNKLENLNELLNEKENEINIILKNNNKYIIPHNNSHNELSSIIINDLKFNKNETLLLNKIKEKDDITNKINLYLNKPEYNLTTYYSSLEKQSKIILNQIDILTNNKKELEKSLKYINNPILNETVNISNKTLINTTNLTKNKKYIEKLQTRISKNKLIIIDNKKEIGELNIFYKSLFDKEDTYDFNSKERLRISKERTTIKYKNILDINNDNVAFLINQEEEIKNNLVLMKNEKHLIKKKQELFISNNKHYFNNINNEIINNNKNIAKYNLLLK